MPEALIAIAIVLKFALYVSVFIAAGSALVTLIFGLQHTTDLMRRVTLAALFVLVTMYGINVIILAGNMSGLLDVEIWALLSETQYGSVFFLQLIALVSMLVCSFIKSAGRWFTAGASLVLLYAFTLTGHIESQGSLISSLFLLVHLIAVAVWIGILIPLRTMALSGDKLEQTADIAYRFGQIATVFVPCLLLAGLYMAWTTFDSLSTFINSGYGQILLLKVFCVSILLVLAARNKLQCVPQLKQGDSTAAIRLAKTIQLEWFMVAMILLLTAILTVASHLP